MAKQKDFWSDKAMKRKAKEIDALLAKEAGELVEPEELVEYRTDDSQKIALPGNPNQMPIDEGIERLKSKRDNEEVAYDFTAPFKCKPKDGANAFKEVFKALFELPTIGVTQQGFWGSTPPQMVYAQINHQGHQVQVPWGLVEYPRWKAQFYLGEYHDAEFGRAFQIRVLAKKKYEKQIQGFLARIKKYIRQHSLYRGKSMRGVTAPEPEFYDPYSLDRDKISYSKDVFEALTDQVFGMIKSTDLFRKANAGYEVVDQDGNPVLDEDGKPIIERTNIRIGNNVLFHGTNGVGKTAACAIAAQYCLEHGWTFGEVKWHEPLAVVNRFVDSIDGPMCFVIEDVENLFHDPDALQQLLGEFDGLRNKGQELMLLMTSNHIKEIPKSMLGGHRVDHTIFFDSLDEPGVERLVTKNVPSSQRSDLDFSRLGVAYEGFSAAQIRRSLEDVARHSIIRTGKLGQPHTTEDFERAAHALRPAWLMHQEATDRPEKPVLESALKDVIEPVVREVTGEVMRRHYIDLQDGEIMVR